jgi:hypothetical protein
MSDGRVCYNSRRIIVCFKDGKQVVFYRIYQSIGWGPPIYEDWVLRGYEMTNNEWNVIDNAVKASNIETQEHLN